MFAVAAVAGLLGVAPGCAMLMNGFCPTEEISITSVPSGVNVCIRRVAQTPSADPPALPADLASQLGAGLRTPCRVALPKGPAYSVTFSRAGYPSAVASITTEHGAWYYANAFMPFGCVLLMPLDSLFGTGTVLAPHNLCMMMGQVDVPRLSHAREGPSIGSTFDVSVHWPSGPEASYFILAMSSRPPTELGVGALEQFAVAAPVPEAWGLTVTGLNGSTDGRGTALVRLEVPDDPALVGKSLYFVCVGLGEDREAFRSDPCQLTVGAWRDLGISQNSWIR